jgi:hypothetical protein
MELLGSQDICHKMTDASHVPVILEDWKGLYTRGVTDSTPQGYFLESLNVKFNESDVYTRDGSTKLLSIFNIVRFFIYKRLGETIRYIYLNTSGQLFDSLYPDVPIWTDATFTDFSGLNFNNRFYITPHNRVTGIASKFLLVYDGSGTARLAAGSAPTGFTLGAVESAVAGNCEIGTHLVAVCFVSNTGFVSAPGPTLFAVVASTGGFAIDLSALPIGPAGTVQRQIVATKAIQDYNGNQLGYQFFFVSSIDGGLINDNSSTTGRISFFDAELLTDATYLFTARGQIPAGVCLSDYNGRLCVAGVNGDSHSIYISEPYLPEQISTLTGTITVDPFASGIGVTNLFVFRGNLTICKSHRLYQTQDNQGDPNTWPTPISIDPGVGTECFGVATIADAKGQQTDRTFIADRSGLILFSGYATRPEATWVCENTWERINKNVFNKIQVCVDTETSSIFVTLPLDNSNTISHILFGYYGNAYGPYGFDAREIRWTLWQTNNGVSSIAVDVDTTTGASVLKYSGSTNHLYQIANDYSTVTDDGIAFTSYVKTALYSTKAKYIQHLALIGLRALGSGTLVTTCYGQDDVLSSTLANITMSAAPGSDYELKANFQSIRIAVKFLTGNNANEYFKISRADLYLKPTWLSKPA